MLAAIAAVAVLGGAPSPRAAALAAPTPANSPMLEAKTKLIFGPTPDGSIRPCMGNLVPNCVSTASTNDLYSPPWRAPLTVAEAARVLERAVPSAAPSARLVKSEDDVAGTGAAYRAWQADGLFGPDVFEVVIKPERTPRGGLVERGAVAETSAAAETSSAAADGPEFSSQKPSPPSQSSSPSSALVTYRSSATSVQYIFPIQLPLTDGGAQRKRAVAVRASSNFSLVGCSVRECFVE